MSDMPREIWADDNLGYQRIKPPLYATPIGREYTHYIRASELEKAYEVIVELADRVAHLEGWILRNHPDNHVDTSWEKKHSAIIKTAREQGK